MDHEFDGFKFEVEMIWMEALTNKPTCNISDYFGDIFK